MRPIRPRSFASLAIRRPARLAFVHPIAIGLLALPIALAAAGNAAAADESRGETANAAGRSTADPATDSPVKSATGSGARPSAPPSAAYRAAMKRFLVAQNIPTQMGEQMAYSAAEQVLAPLAAQGVSVTEPMQAIVIDEARKAFGARYGDVDYLTDLYAGIYAQHLSEKEMSELAAFWETPAAKKLVESTPKINEAFFGAMQSTTGPMFTTFQTQIEKRMREAGVIDDAKTP